MKRILLFTSFIFLLVIFNNVFARDSSTAYVPTKTRIKVKQLQPATDASLLSPETVTSKVTPTVSETGKISCPSGYAITEVNIGERMFWDERASSTQQRLCNEGCNTGYPWFNCACGDNYCPSGCFAGCTNRCNYTQTTFHGGWSKSSTVLGYIPLHAADYGPVSFTCSKISNTVWADAP